MRVKESIEFKRGISTKKALETGRDHMIKSPEFLQNLMSKELITDDIGELIGVYTWKGTVESFELNIKSDVFKNKFKEDKKELVKFLGTWLIENTPFYLSELVQYGETLYGDGIYACHGKLSKIEELEN